MRLTILLSGLAVCLLVVLSACGVKPVLTPDNDLPPECILMPSPEDDVSTVSVAVTGSGELGVDEMSMDALDPLIAGVFFETLISVDCTGTTRSSLALRWNAADSGRVWSFTLRDDARFWDGNPVTAQDVSDSWDLYGPKDGVIDSVKIDGERQLSVYFQNSYSDVPAVLSSYDFAVIKPVRDSRLLMGTGPYRISSTNAVGVTALPVSPEVVGPTIRFVNRSGRDARDLLESSIDLLVTRDPTVIEYAERRSRLVTFDLPWDRTYVLISTSRVLDIVAGGTPGAITGTLSDGFFRDAVRGDARVSSRPAWWKGSGSCFDISSGPREPARYAPGDDKRILYDVSDDVARQLAERFVALRAMDLSTFPEGGAFMAAVPGMITGGTDLISTGAGSTELEESLKYGSDYAYIIPVGRRPYDSCREARDFVRRAPWLESMGTGLWDATIPLVDTRPDVIAVRDRFGLSVDWSGNLRIRKTR